MSNDKAKLRIRIDSSRDATAGVAAGYVLRRLAARAGAYAPGIQEQLFHEITLRTNGSTLAKVEQWLEAQSRRLAHLGYNIVARRTAVPSDEVVGWVSDGMGFRAALAAVDGSKLYRTSSTITGHAIALVRHDETSGIPDADLEPGVVVIDPLPGQQRFRAVPETLDRAHIVYKYETLLLFWAGYS